MYKNLYIANKKYKIPVKHYNGPLKEKCRIKSGKSNAATSQDEK